MHRAFRYAVAISSLALASTLAPTAADAQCGGFCLYEVATPQQGVSYAGAGAVAEDAATVWLNPAGMTRIETNEMLFQVTDAMLIQAGTRDIASPSASRAT